MACGVAGPLAKKGCGLGGWAPPCSVFGACLGRLLGKERTQESGPERVKLTCPAGLPCAALIPEGARVKVSEMKVR